MKYLLMLLVTALVGSGLTGYDLSLAPGLSIKNMLLYSAAGLLFVRVVVRRDVRFELPGVTVAFLILIGYAVATWVVAAFVLEYPGYSFSESGMSLKNKLIDYMLIFWVFFYGLKREEAIEVLRFTLLVFCGANLLGVFYYFGLIRLDGLYNPYDDRLRGFVGEVNQYGTVIACVVPVTAALLFYSRSISERLAWLLVLVLSLAVLLLSGSRGAVAGLLTGGVVTWWFYRKLVPLPKVLATLSSVALLGAVVVALVTASTGDYLFQRYIADSQTTGLANVSSGRTDIWMGVLALMSDAPMTFVTGFGWNAYFSLPFRPPPHNTYLHYWFDLGIIGLFGLVWIVWRLLSVLWRSASKSVGLDRAVLVGCSAGAVAAAFSALFVELPVAWPYLWIIFGLSVRLATRDWSAYPMPSSIPVGGLRVTSDVDSEAGASDAFGWKASARLPERR